MCTKWYVQNNIERHIWNMQQMFFIYAFCFAEVGIEIKRNRYLARKIDKKMKVH